MHARHRSPGNGYKSNSVGMGLAASRISPEGSIRGHGLYNSEYRNFNRGLGRGQSKPYQPQQPPRKGDIFMEAGRLAAEYLVSQGLLSASVLSVKWQNGTSKKHAVDFQEFKPHEGDSLHLAQEGRTSALARLGNAVPDAVSGRRRVLDEYYPTGSRNHMKGRRRPGSFRSYDLNWGRENGRGGSWSDKARASPDMEGDDDSASGYQEEQQICKDGSGVRKSYLNELVPKNDDAGDLLPEIEKYQSPDDMGSKASSGVGKDLPLETDVDLSKMAEDSGNLNAGSEEVKDGTSNDETEKQSTTEDLPSRHCAAEGDNASKNITDLLRLCRMAKVPTRTRSSLTYKGSKVGPLPITEEENIPDVRPPKGSGESIADESVNGSLGDAFSIPTLSSKCIDSDISRALSAQSVDDFGELGPSYSVEQNKCLRSHSFPDGAFLFQQEAVQGPPGFGRCSSMVKERGEKRAAQHNDARGETKKPREWLSSTVTLADKYFSPSNSREKELSSQEEKASPGKEAIVATDHHTSVDISLFAKGDDEPCIEYAGEKQLFPSSFKICDLNLMEASDMNENLDSDPILMYPSISETKKEAGAVDIDLSISNNCNISDEYDKRAADGKEIEVIDLENDSVQEDKAFNNSDRKTETVFTSLEGFPSNPHNTSDIHDVQDGYGLMISELLGTDITNCSSVRADINSLNNEMGLNNGEGILGDDDPIYMSLEEIPISFLRVWEQPTQEYEKPF